MKESDESDYMIKLYQETTLQSGQCDALMLLRSLHLAENAHST